MILVDTLPAPPIRKAEVFRYAASVGGEPAVAALIEDCFSEIADRLSYRVCFTRCAITRNHTGLSFAGINTESKTLSTALANCDELLLFAATVGVEIDRAITRYSRLSPARALVFQAIGAERIEALCDSFCEKQACALREDLLHLKPRVSPGYGDIPLELQGKIFSVLDCPRKIGLTLNDSFLMSPTKSVTAIAGITRQTI